MTPEKQVDLLIKLNANVEILLDRHTVREKMCDVRLRMIEDLGERVDIVEDFMDREILYRKWVIGLLVGISGLITWGMNLVPKAIEIFTRSSVGNM